MLESIDDSENNADLVVNHIWKPIPEQEIDEEKRKITGPKILSKVIFTLALGTALIYCAQQLNLELPAFIPKITFVNDSNGNSSQLPFFRFKQKGNSTDLVMKITAPNYKEEDHGGWGDGTMVSTKDEAGNDVFWFADTYHKNCLPNVLSYLKKNKINKFSIYISHNDVDHTGNLIELVKQFDVPTVYLPDLKSFRDDWEAKIKKANPNTQVVYLKEGSKFKIGVCDAEVLLGPKFADKKGDENNQSLITRITTPQGVRFLMAGDAEKELEKMALEAGIDLKADIFKMSHHGGETSNTAAFVKAINPSYYYYNYNCGGHGAKEKEFGKAGWIKKPVEILDSLGNGASVLFQGQLDWYIYGSTKIEFSAEKSNTTERVTFTQTIDGKEVKFTHNLTKGSSHIYTEQMKNADRIEYLNTKKTSKLYDFENRVNARVMADLYKPYDLSKVDIKKEDYEIDL